MRAKFGVTKKDRIGKLKATRWWYFMLRPQWSDHFEFWHVASYRRRNHSRRNSSFGVL